MEGAVQEEEEGRRALQEGEAGRRDGEEAKKD